MQAHDVIGKLRRASPRKVWRKSARYWVMRQAASEADAFLCSYPKSGRTWLRYIISHYLDQVHALGIDIDLQTTFSVTPNFDLDPVRGIPAFRTGPAHGRAPMVLVSHLRPLQLLFRDRPVIFMTRDPRDVVVSAYYHATGHKKSFSGTMDEFLQHRELGLPTFIEYHRRWGEALLRTPHVVVTYEDLTRDSVVTVRRILDFLGWRDDVGAVEKAIALSSFDKMRKAEIRSGIPGHEYDRGNEEALRVRKGKIGGFADSLTDAQAQFVLDRVSAQLPARTRTLLGYDSYTG